MDESGRTPVHPPSRLWLRIRQINDGRFALDWRDRFDEREFNSAVETADDSLGNVGATHTRRLLLTRAAVFFFVAHSGNPTFPSPVTGSPNFGSELRLIG
jgi:hypothetical protein